MATSLSNKNSTNKWRTIFFLLTTLTFTVQQNAATSDALAPICETITCPPFAELNCPEDSDIRETFNMSNASLVMNHENTESAMSPSVGSATGAPSVNPTITDELYAQCCLAPKCMCRTCYIRDCPNDEVVVELQPEAMETPGHCCGLYECMAEPNCTEVHDITHYWLRNCQRCKCYSGSRICHDTCAEDKKLAAMCKSSNLNTFFKHGDSWKDGCYACECVYGEEKCVMPFCASVSCPTHRQVMLKDSCCPICWPKGIPMPDIGDNFDTGYDDDENTNDSATGDNHAYDDNDVDDIDDDIPLLPLKPLEDELGQSNSTTSAPDNLASSTRSSATSLPSAAESSPCQNASGGSKYSVYPELVEVLSEQHSHLYYNISIAILAMAVVVLLAFVIQLRNKQRSYRPVSNFDDNFNKMSTNIKKMNEYA